MVAAGLFCVAAVCRRRSHLAQTWTKPGSDHQDVKFGTQYFLKKKPAESTITPDFFNAPVTEDSGNCCPGVTIQGNPDNVTAMTLTDVSYSVPMPVFNGEVKHVKSAMGFSFNYSFTGGCTDGAQLQIYFDGYPSPYFAMTGSVATSDDLPGSGSLSATFGMGTEYNGWKTLQIVLVPSAAGDANGPDTTVTLSNFHEFKL